MTLSDDRLSFLVGAGTDAADSVRVITLQYIEILLDLAMAC